MFGEGQKRKTESHTSFKRNEASPDPYEPIDARIDAGKTNQWNAPVVNKRQYHPYRPNITKMAKRGNQSALERRLAAVAA